MSSSSSVSALADATAALTLSPKDHLLINSCTAILLKLLERLEQESSVAIPCTVLIDAAHLSDYSALLSHAITKLVLFVSNADAAGAAAILLSQSEELSNHLTALSALLRSMLSTSIDGKLLGPTRRSAILTVHTDLLHGLKPLINQLQLFIIAKSSAANQANPNSNVDVTLIGRTWETLEKSLKSIPLTNASAVGRLINQQCSVIKDAQEELKLVHIKGEGKEREEKEETKAGEADDDDDGGEDGDEFDDDDDAMLDAGGDDALSAAEFAIVPSVVHLTSTASTLVKSLYMYLLKVSIDESQSSQIDFLESLLSQVRLIGHRLDDMIGSLYSPQDRQAVKQAINVMAQQLRENAFRLVKHNIESGAEWPMKSSAAAATGDSAAAASSATAPADSSLTACAACQQVLLDATALQAAASSASSSSSAAAPESADAAQHPRIQWLRRCLLQIHEGHALADACEATIA